jgi:hypothetical protein
MFWINLAVMLLGVSLVRSLIRRITPRAHDHVLDTILILIFLVGASIQWRVDIQGESEKQSLRQSLQATLQKHAITEQALRQLREHQRARTLTSEQRQGLLCKLQQDPKGFVNVMAIMNDGESNQFATELEQVLREAGWTTHGVGVGLWAGGTPLGVFVECPSTGAVPSHADHLLWALSESDLLVYNQIVRTDDAAIPNLPDGAILLVVGQKPWPRN